MTTVLALVVVAVLIAGFSYFTNAGFGDRKPPEDKTKKKSDQASGETGEPPPAK